MAVSTIKKTQVPFRDLSGVDLNTLVGNENAGFYYLRTGNPNAPDTWSWMLVIGGIGTVQVVFGPNSIKVRQYTGSPLAWTAWKIYLPS